MDDLHKLAQRIADEAFSKEFRLSKGGEAGVHSSAVYHAVYRAIMDRAEDIAVLFCDSEWKRPDERRGFDPELGGAMDRAWADMAASAEIDPIDVITVIDAHNDLIDALKDILTYSRREPENLGDADAILTDILERAKEALNG